MRYRLLIVWEDGEKNEYFYKTREEAETIRDGYRTAFGKQISFMCIDTTK